LSGLEVLESGRFIAVGDEADWIEAQLELDDEGRLAGFIGARGAFMRDERGRAFRSKADGDSEGLALLADGRFAVSFERTNLIRIYDLNRDGPFGAAAMGPRLADVNSLAPNAGLEALAALDDALLAGAEGGLHATTPLWLIPLDARDPTPPRFEYPLGGGFSLTAMDRLPDGGFVAVERFYAPIIGPRARITRFDLPEAGEGLVEVEVLAELNPPFPLDHFEAISAVRTAEGTTRLYILSDNNGSTRQRTLLLAFDILENSAD
jgi:hypothetical protein